MHTFSGNRQEEGDRLTERKRDGMSGPTSIVTTFSAFLRCFFALFSMWAVCATVFKWYKMLIAFAPHAVDLCLCV